MANYIGEHGKQNLIELKKFLGSRANYDLKNKIITFCEEVPGSRSIIGYLRYQLFEKSEDFSLKRLALVDEINKLLKRQHQGNVPVYKFVKDDADSIAYLLKDLKPKPADTSGFAKLKSFSAIFMNRFGFINDLMQPGWKRYLLFILLLSYVLFFLLNPFVFHIGILASIGISFGFMALAWMGSKIGSNSDIRNPQIPVYSFYKPKQIQEEDTLSKLSKTLGSLPNTPENELDALPPKVRHHRPNTRQEDDEEKKSNSFNLR